MVDGICLPSWCTIHKFIQNTLFNSLLLSTESAWFVCWLAGGNALPKIFSANQPKPHGPFVGAAMYTVYVYGHSSCAFRLRDSGSMFLATVVLYTYLPR